MDPGDIDQRWLCPCSISKLQLYSGENDDKPSDLGYTIFVQTEALAPRDNPHDRYPGVNVQEILVSVPQLC